MNIAKEISNAVDEVKELHTSVRNGQDMLLHIAAEAAELETDGDAPIFADLKSIMTAYTKQSTCNKVVYAATEAALKADSPAQMEDIFIQSCQNRGKVDNKNIERLEHTIATNLGKVISNLTGLVEKQSVASADEEEALDLELDMPITQVAVSFNCPITRQPMKEPVRNTVCNHNYERDAILEHIEARRKKGRTTRCPYSGCGNKQPVTSDVITANEELKLKIRTSLR